MVDICQEKILPHAFFKIHCQKAFEKERPMGQWRDVVQSLYNIKLEL